MPPPTSNPPPATRVWTPSCPRSNCGSKSNWPKRGSTDVRRRRPRLAHRFLRRNRRPPPSADRPILSGSGRRYIRRARTEAFPSDWSTDLKFLAYFASIPSGNSGRRAWPETYFISAALLPKLRKGAAKHRAIPEKGAQRTDGLVLEKLKNYRPSEKEPFMNDRQRDYFRAKLLAWKDEILRESRVTLQTLQEENVNHPDLADRASSETDRAIELRARDRQRKLISKIDAALQRIEDNTYGYCEETGEPISLKRLEARPIATLSVEAQERHEKREKVYRDE